MSDNASSLARTIMRFWLPIAERKRRKALVEAFNVTRDQAIYCESKGFTASATIFNIALYFLIAERDIQCLKIEALTHPDEWKRKLCARVILLTIYEWDMDKVSGRALKEALETVGAPHAIHREAVESLRKVRVAQRKAQKEFGPLRNTTIAHRDPNALQQYDAINSLSVDRVFDITKDFYVAAESFSAILPKLVGQTSEFPALLRQWAKYNSS